MAQQPTPPPASPPWPAPVPFHQTISAYATLNAVAQGGGTAIVNNVTYRSSSPPPVDAAATAMARQRLALLPLEAVPTPAPLPQPSHMPLTPNPLFAGRDDALRSLAAALKNVNVAASIPGRAKTVAVTGLGGMGKTQLATEFVHRYGQYFAGVFWLSFATDTADTANASAGLGTDAGQAAESLIAPQISECGGPGCLDLGPGPVYYVLQQGDQVRKVLGAWQSGLPYLLVFDNCEDEALLDRWRPPSGACRILVTSRRAEWAASLGVTTLPLGELRRPDSIALLCQHGPGLAAEDPDLDAIAAELGDLPLALHLAGGYLRDLRDDVTPADYLRELRSPAPLQHESLRGDEGCPLPTRHKHGVARTFALSYERLDGSRLVDARARDVLVRTACLAPGALIPRELLRATLGEEGATPVQFGKVVQRLADLGLLEVEAGGGLRMHRLLAVFVREAAPDEAAQAAVEGAVLAEATRLNATGEPVSMAALQPHLRAVTDAVMARIDWRAAALCNALGHHLYMIGAYEQAAPYMGRASTLFEQGAGPDHPDTAATLSNFGALLQAQGKRTAARPFLERALAIREQALGPDHPDTAASLNNLSLLSKAQGEYTEARALAERAVAIWADTLGSDHPTTTIGRDNLAQVVQAQGDLATARTLLERALGIMEARVGPSHPDTATTLNNLAWLLYQQGELAIARPLIERALRIREQVLGPEHPDTATTLNNLALVLHAQGDGERARRLFERVLAIRERTLGQDHPGTIASLDTLGALLASQREYEDARPLAERVLALQKRMSGLDHPDTATSLINLATVLQRQGKPTSARPLFEQALRIREQMLGDDHPATVAVLSDLGDLLMALKDYASVRPLFERIVASRERTLGPRHRETAHALDNLGAQRLMEGDRAGAGLCYERALAIREEALGLNHPYTILSRTNMARVRQMESDRPAGGVPPLKADEDPLHRDHPRLRQVE